jgi:cell division protein ZapA
MESKNKVEVRIHGKEYTLKGVESEEYLQRIAYYIDKKMAEVSKDSVRMSAASTSILTALNIADDYFKLQDSIADTKKELEEKTKEIAQLKEDLNNLKIKNTQILLEHAKMKNELDKKKKK